MNKRLSIVIPAFNEASFLARCLDSISNQTTMPNAVIVVDNNSSDGTNEIAKKYSFVTVAKEQKQGISHAHHKGFSAAKSELIARIDADSVLPKDWVEDVLKFYELARDNRTVLVGSGYCTNLKAPIIHTKLMDATFYGSWLMLGGKHSVWGPNCVIPKVSWDKIKDQTCPEKTTTYDDFDIALHLHDQKIPIVWKRDLRVGVRLKHLDSLRKFIRYTMRWPGTLQNHHDKRAYYVYPLTLVLTLLQFPVLYVLNKKK